MRNGRNLSPLEGDLEHLEKMAENQALPAAQKQEALRKAKLIREGLEIIPQLEEEAKQLGIEAWCQGLEDDLLAELVAEVVREADARETALGAFVYNAVLPYKSLFPHSEFQPLYQWFFDLLCVALCDEIECRRKTKEKDAGRAVRELLVEESDRGKLLGKLARRTTWKLWWPGEPKGAGSTEVEEMAIAFIWERVAPLTQVSPVAANPEALVASMQGRLNKVLRNVRDHIRTLIETELRHSGHLKYADEVPAPDLDGNQGEPPIFRLRAEAPDLDKKLLCEQLVSRAGLTPKEEKVLLLCEFEGYTQQGAAGRMGVSQSQVSKLITSRMEKLSNVAHPKGDIGHPA